MGVDYGTMSGSTIESKPIGVSDYDLVIVGAGISGINMAYRFQEHFRTGTYIVLEARKAMGGTWDLMKYPGIRSDSHLHSFGFEWKPWSEENPIAEGGKIVRYLKEATAENGIDEKIHYQHKVTKTSWQSREQKWTLEVDATGEAGEITKKLFRGKFMVLGTGYYDYDKAMTAEIPGIENFSGKVVHPQFWPEGLDYAHKKVAVIGSGATAITLVPAMAKMAEKVTMVQRSPSYIVSLPNRIRPKTWWERILPLWIQYKINRIRYMIGGFFYRRYLAQNSDQMRESLAKITQAQLPKHIPYDPHFKPRYRPWTQRVCVCPDGDFFKALHKGNVDIATGIISTVTPNSITMENGQNVEADIIVTATGLHIKYGGNADIYVDGEELKWGDKFFWRGVMIQDVPNMAFVMGYTMATWTLGADATATLVCRMIKHLERNKLTSATPRIPVVDVSGGQKEMVKLTSASGVMGLTSTYIKNAMHRLPKTSDDKPWRARGNYLEDMWDARWSSLSRGMQFVQAAQA
ncbi:hypothetical protein BLS_000266 [Venturia inaequalis]|uniref:Uncharacterized protein n=1 Tax=Venturia inaequalis TaxID=5025 RepID=A0A8H3U3C1_VENIN|nr:hypothetical protein BLS_000266 [Venturia inaequalis]KAE9973617.1 hypothetical protein EG328_004288 [Venturia inaequalis]RDI78697.1 High osmolarity signaling protein [Venturia inaequalis]